MTVHTDNHLDEIFSSTTDVYHTLSSSIDPVLQIRESGTVLDIDSGIARVSGLPRLSVEELVEFSSGTLGIATDLNADSAGIILLDDSSLLSSGMSVIATERMADVPVGDALIGRVMDATGRPLDSLGPINSTKRQPIERAAPSIMERAPVVRPLETGIKAVDALIPIGRGQRELILGDRQTGKTSVAIDAILNQRDKNVICIYCSIGQRGTATARVIDILREHDAMAYTLVVATSGHDTPGMQYITPYAATTIAEYFRDQGRDVLIVYDDLTRHARVYRELSLLLRRPPGREAYPGDIFYVHSRLLERAAQLNEEAGGGSLTALPIVETQAQDIAAYIPTNLISITDGQIYLSPALFHKHQLPAIDIGRSVSRVGGASQRAALREIAGSLRLAYSQFEELQSFARFATRLDEETRSRLTRGERVRDALRQNEHQLVSCAAQVVTLQCASMGLFDALGSNATQQLLARIEQRVPLDLPELSMAIESGNSLNDADRSRIAQFASTMINH